MSVSVFTRLSPNFILSEFVSTSHKDLLPAQQREVQDYVHSLTYLCKSILEPIRVYFDKPFIITSGFRGKELNKTVGGNINSQHCRGEAADFMISGIDNKQIMKDIKEKKINIEFGQCIHEIIKGKDWIHISLGFPYRLKEKCMQMLDTKDGKKYEVYNG